MKIAKLLAVCGLGFLISVPLSVGLMFIIAKPIKLDLKDPCLEALNKRTTHVQIIKKGQMSGVRKFEGVLFVCSVKEVI